MVTQSIVEPCVVPVVGRVNRTMSKEESRVFCIQTGVKFSFIKHLLMIWKWGVNRTLIKCLNTKLGGVAEDGLIALAFTWHTELT
jgi:hypothetical protein